MGSGPDSLDGRYTMEHVLTGAFVDDGGLDSVDSSDSVLEYLSTMISGTLDTNGSSVYVVNDNNYLVTGQVIFTYGVSRPCARV